MTSGSKGMLELELAASTLAPTARPPRARRPKAEASEEEEEEDTPLQAPVVTARGRQTKPTSKVGELIAAKEVRVGMRGGCSRPLIVRQLLYARTTVRSERKLNSVLKLNHCLTERHPINSIGLRGSFISGGIT
jgi:hypothetical protein